MQQNQNQNQNARTARRYPAQRFLTGIGLGLILTGVIQTFIPLLGQAADGRPSQAIAQTAPALAPPTDAGGDTASDPRSPVPPPAAIPPQIPQDIDEHWAADCLRGLSDRQHLPLDATGQFYPDGLATWTAVTSLLTTALPTEATAYSGASPIETALALDTPVNPLFSYPNRYYDPLRTITRAEAITALTARLGLPYVARPNALLQAAFEDGNRIPAYGREGVAAALAAGKVVAYPEPQTLHPSQLITRGEVAALICQAHPQLQATVNPAWVAAAPTLPTQTAPNREVRGVWLTNIDSDILFSEANVESGVDRLAGLNFNTLYPVVWNGGYTLYPSAVGDRWLGRPKRLHPGENPAFEAAQGDRDMLQEVIDHGHEAGMAVIPWFEFGFMAPGNYDLRQQHPEWFTQRRDGSQDIVQGQETFTWLNPFHPQVQQLLLLLVEEVLETYAVDGIQFDDHLGLPVDMGYDPYTVALYQQEHGGAVPPEDENDPSWVRWRADKITEFVGNLHRLVKDRNPQAIVSISPNPYPFAYERYLQDWPTWEQQGYLEELVVQIYRDNLDRFAWELSKPSLEQARRRVTTSIGLLSGLKNRPTNGALLTEQLAATRDRAYAGVSYFFYETLWVPGEESPEERQQGFQTGFPLAAARPDSASP